MNFLFPSSTLRSCSLFIRLSPRASLNVLNLPARPAPDSHDPNLRACEHHEAEMIPHSSAGVQPWANHMRSLNNGGRVEAPPALGPPSDSQPDKLPVSVPPSQPRQPAVIDLTSTGDARDREPPAKRLRLEFPAVSSARDGSPASGSSGEPRSTPGTATPKPPALAWRGRPVWSFQALISETPGGGGGNTGGGETKEDDATDAAQGGKTSPPPLPALPWKYPPPQRPGSNATKSRDSSPSKAVQTTPYHIEVPAVAPAIKGDSKWFGRWFSEPDWNNMADKEQGLRISRRGLGTTRKMF